jgi:hypothetical protein
MSDLAGLIPTHVGTTSGVTGRCSKQLNYNPVQISLLLYINADNLSIIFISYCSFLSNAGHREDEEITGVTFTESGVQIMAYN